VTISVAIRVGFPVDDVSLSRLHALAFGGAPGAVLPWAERLREHSLSWVGAFDQDSLIGFVHACWDGGLHAFLLDTVVDPRYRRQGVGQKLVQSLVQQVGAAGCEWLHVDYEPHLDSFYRVACGFEATTAGLLRVSQ
jgi:GNAT superfamily N-acetyltransferase